jgi:hypothetical protein
MFRYVEHEQLHLVLVSMMKKLATDYSKVPGGDGALVRVLACVRKFYGVDQVVRPEDSPQELHIRVPEAYLRFCNLLLAIYPYGNHRLGGPILMDFRREILRTLAEEWGGQLDARGLEFFDAFWFALVSREGVQADDSEEEMILGVLRARMKDSATFTEPVLRTILQHLDGDNRYMTGSGRLENNLFMVFAIARTRNGGKNEVMQDVTLREKEEM